MHYWFVPRGEPCVFVVLKSSIFWTDAKKDGGTAVFVDGGAIACCISGSFGGGGLHFSHSWRTPLSFDQHTAPSAPSMSNNERTTQEHAGGG